MPINMAALAPLAEAVERAGGPILAGALRAASTVSGAAPFPLSIFLPPVLAALAEAVGGSADDPVGIAAKIVADPDARSKVGKVEDDHGNELASAANDALKLQVDQNAAELGVESASIGKVFFAGWRPAFAWSVVFWANVILVLTAQGQKVTPEFLAVWNPIWIAFGGLMGLRSVEKFGGVATEALKSLLPKAKKLLPVPR